MKKIFLFISFLLATVSAIFFSCKKETSCEGCKENNKPPIAIAGPDQVITLPVDSILLDGSASNDPDGTISVWLWTKISGPASFNVNKPNDSITLAKALTTGTYQFELKVSDNGGLSSKDTVQIIVNNSVQPNRPPIANAGADQIITLPTNTTTLNGSGSSDPDNNITNYLWTKISGPSSSISNPNAVQAQVTSLAAGVYQFELKVTDAGGLFSIDTMNVNVNSVSPQPCDNSNRPMINAQLIPVGTISQTRTHMSVASAGNKILFAGGWAANGAHSSRVDIYDITTYTWITAELCVARSNMASVSSGNKIFFGGGEYGDGTWPVDSVDIYDVANNTWTVAHLSTAGHSIAGAAVGNKVFFAGGDQGFNGTQGLERATQVDIYDISTNIWSTTQLSEMKRVGHQAVTAGNRIYFAGGETWPTNNWVASNKMEVYDNATNTWSISTLVEGKVAHTGIVAGDKIYWAGGITGGSSISQNSCLVEVRDINTGSSTIHHLFKPGDWWQGSGQQAVVMNNKILFFRHYEPGAGPDKFDIYEITTNTWSIGVLPVHINGFSVISVNNIIYIAGGVVNGALSNQVYKLEF